MLTLSTAVVLGFLSWSLYPYALGSDRVPIAGGESSAHFAVFEVEGMTCGGCEVAVDGAVRATGLADSVKSSFTSGKAYVWYKNDNLNLDTFEAAMRSVGYTSRLLENK